jgi:hypothetical protein
MRAGYADSAVSAQVATSAVSAMTATTATTANGTNGAGRIVVQDGTDGGNSKGIFMWTSGDSNWGIYMAQAGAGRSLSGGYAPAGSGFSQHAVRFRTYSSDANRGWIFEGSDNQLKMSLRSSDGYLWVRGQIVNDNGGARVFGTEFSYDYPGANNDYFTNGGSIQGDSPYLNFGLYVQNTIRGAGIVVFSDRRIKSNIVDIHDTTALDQISQLKPK